METAKAQLNNLRMSPRKVRLVADYMRGKYAEDALNGLKFLDKRAAIPMKKLLESALANAKDRNIDTENLFVKEISVDQGDILYRRLPAARGRAMTMRKKTSHVKLVLIGKERKAKKKSAKPRKAEAAKK